MASTSSEGVYKSRMYASCCCAIKQIESEDINPILDRPVEFSQTGCRKQEGFASDFSSCWFPVVKALLVFVILCLRTWVSLSLCQKEIWWNASSRLMVRLGSISSCPFTMQWQQGQSTCVFNGEMIWNDDKPWYFEAQSPKERSNACRQGSHLQGYMGREVCWRTATPCHTHHTDLSRSRRSRFHLDHPWQSRCCVVPIEKGHAKPTKPSAALASFVLEWRLPRNSFPSGKNADSVGPIFRPRYWSIEDCSMPCLILTWKSRSPLWNRQCQMQRSPSQVRLGNLRPAIRSGTWPGSTWLFDTNKRFSKVCQSYQSLSLILGHWSSILNPPSPLAAMVQAHIPKLRPPPLSFQMCSKRISMKVWKSLKKSEFPKKHIYCKLSKYQTLKRERHGNFQPGCFHPQIHGMQTSRQKAQMTHSPIVGWSNPAMLWFLQLGIQTSTAAKGRLACDLRDTIL